MKSGVWSNFLDDMTRVCMRVILLTRCWNEVLPSALHCISRNYIAYCNSLHSSKTKINLTSVMFVCFCVVVWVKMHKVNIKQHVKTNIISTAQQWLNRGELARTPSLHTWYKPFRDCKCCLSFLGIHDSLSLAFHSNSQVMCVHVVH